MVTRFRVEIRPSATGTVVAVEGELDLATTGTFERDSAPAMQSGHGPLIVDLRGVAFMDSTGLRAVLGLYEAAKQAGRRFALVRGSAQVQRLLELTRVDRRVPMIDEPDEVPAVSTGD